MAKFSQRKKALQLRRQGMSMNAIAKTLGISKGTVSVWCRDIPLTDSQRNRLRNNSIRGGHLGRLRGAEVNRQKRLNTVIEESAHARRDIESINSRDLMLLAAGLYWAEGTKVGSNFIFVNSDPAMIVLMCRFLYECLEITPNRIHPTIQINSIHRSRIKEVTKFWAQTLGIPVTQFANPYFVRTVQKKKYDNQTKHYGTLRLRVLRSSVLQYRMLGYISALKGNADVAQVVRAGVS